MGELIPYIEQFEHVVDIIESAKERAYRKVNEELILMYRDIGEYISIQSENAEYGDAFVQKLADFFATNYPDLKGFTRRGLYRMKQFYELYKDDEIVSCIGGFNNSPLRYDHVCPDCGHNETHGMRNLKYNEVCCCNCGTVFTIDE